MSCWQLLSVDAIKNFEFLRMLLVKLQSYFIGPIEQILFSFDKWIQLCKNRLCADRVTKELGPEWRKHALYSGMVIWNSKIETAKHTDYTLYIMRHSTEAIFPNEGNSELS